MSPGKMSAQVAHAAMAFLTTMIRNSAVEKHPYRYRASECYTQDGKLVPMLYKRGDLYSWAKEAFENGKDFFCAKPVNPEKPYGSLELCDDKKIYTLSTVFDADLFEQWINGAFTKCVLKAKNKSHLMKAKAMAEQLDMQEGVDYFLIRDNCNTELEPEDEDGRTLTCIGFKPMDAAVIDKIGKKFQLYI